MEGGTENQGGEAKKKKRKGEIDKEKQEVNEGKYAKEETMEKRGIEKKKGKRRTRGIRMPQ